MFGLLSLDIGAPSLPAPLPLAASVLPPVLILVLCVVAGIGTLLLLPSRKEATLRKIGGAVVICAALIFAALLVRQAASGGQGGMGVYFWVFSAIALGSALRVITHPKPVYSALYFVMTVFASAGLFVLLWAEFMAVALVLIYAGAILVTYVFVIMLAAEATPASGPMAGLAEHDAVSREPLIASAVGFALMGVLLFVIFEKGEGLQSTKYPAAGAASGTFAVTQDLLAQPLTSMADGFNPQGGVQQLGVYLFNNQLINLELSGLILTIAMVGAIVIARRRVVETESVRREARDRATLVAPATPIDDDPHSIPVYGTENPRQKAYPET
ncbi:MAG: NADH-quinone oxidoreductase subunit J [Tepidisphaeraceae bacterium]